MCDFCELLDCYKKKGLKKMCTDRESNLKSEGHEMKKKIKKIFFCKQWYELTIVSCNYLITGMTINDFYRQIGIKNFLRVLCFIALKERVENGNKINGSFNELDKCWSEDHSLNDIIKMISKKIWKKKQM